MGDRRPTSKQRSALMFIEGGTDPSHLAEYCQVQGGYSNEAEFLLRLIDRGWVGLHLTDDGFKALHPCEDEHG